MKSYGANAVFDYNSPTCADDIKKLTRNCLRYVLDPFGEVKTMALCDQAMGRAGGRYTALERYQGFSEKKTTQRELVMGAVIHGRGLALSEGYEKPADEEMRAWGIECYRSIQHLVDEHKLRPHPIKVLEGRFEAILEGLEMLKRKEISGEKLVVRLE